MINHFNRLAYVSVLLSICFHLGLIFIFQKENEKVFRYKVVNLANFKSYEEALPEKNKNTTKSNIIQKPKIDPILDTKPEVIKKDLKVEELITKPKDTTSVIKRPSSVKKIPIEKTFTEEQLDNKKFKKRRPKVI